VCSSEQHFVHFAFMGIELWLPQHGQWLQMEFPAVLQCGWFRDFQPVSIDALSVKVSEMRGGADLGRLFISSPLDQRGGHSARRCFPDVTWLGRGDESQSVDMLTVVCTLVSLRGSD
jgi:hypothetical protein